jgi:minor extracellular serine protease Vpr
MNLEGNMKTTRFILLIVLLLALAVLAGTVLAGNLAPRRDFTEAPAGSQPATGYVVVTFKDPPAASYTGGIPGLAPTKPERGRFDPNSPAAQAYLKHLENVHANYRSWLARNVKGPEIVAEYSLVANGMAIKLNGARPETLQGGPGVRSVSGSWLYQPTMNVSADLIGATALWTAAGGRENAGQGIKVGIIDTGIDDTHRFFECKDEIPSKVYASGVAFDPNNVIVFDHGTHVAGTVAGCLITLGSEEPITGSISGLAPAAELWDYNVFPGFGAGFIAFGGSAFSHDIIAALEDTVQDGMHIVNMSLGGGVQGPHDTLSEAVNATVDAGIVVAVAAGNSGPGDATVNSPGSAAGALTAGASTNPHFIGISVTVGAETFGAALGDFDNFDPPITAEYTVTDPPLGCTTISTDLTGKIALIDRGVCTFTTKIRNAQTAGAVGVLVVNNVAGDPVGMAHDGTDPFPTIPAAMLGKAEGDSIKPSGTVTVDGTVVTEVISDNADIIAGFSSRGPTPFTYLIKPDLTAPGVNVYSSVFDDEFAMFQGTSMATPHLAGSAALLLHLHPDWSPADVKSALVNTAKRPVWDHVTGENPTGVLTRGGGRADLVAANGTPLTIDPASASFGFWSGNKDVKGSLELAIRNVSGGNQTCSVAVSGPDIVTASADSLDLSAGETTNLTLVLAAGKANQTGSGDYAGDVVIDCGGTELKVPWWLRIDRQGKP